MWKKNEPEPPPQPQPARPRPAVPESQREVATIGPSITIKGDLSGDENLLIEGVIEGQIVLKSHNVTVGKSGRVKADIHGRSIRIEGEVLGNLYGQEDVVIRASGRVQGNLVAPRVTLENGARFKGSIDMEAAKEKKVASGPSAPAPVPPRPAGGAGPSKVAERLERTPASGG